MLGELAVGYLFLGGTGAGAIAVASVLDLALVRAPFGTDARVSADEAPPCERVVAFALLAGFAALALGVLCLLFDLGRIDRALDLFLRPSATYLTVGSFALAALVACGAFLALVRQSGMSSAQFLQNVLPRADASGAEQPAMVVLALCAHLLGERGAYRIHGGGFGGSVLAFVPDAKAEAFRAQMDALLGFEACLPVAIGAPGACARRIG